MSTIAESIASINAMGKEICDGNETIRNVAGYVGSKIIDHSVTHTTGIPELGTIASEATSTGEAGDEVAGMVTSLAIGGAVCAASIVAAPVLIVGAIFKKIFG